MTEEIKNHRLILRNLEGLSRSVADAVAEAIVTIEDEAIKCELRDFGAELTRLRYDYIDGCIGLCTQRIDDAEMYKDGNAEHRKDYNASRGCK